MANKNVGLVILGVCLGVPLTILSFVIFKGISKASRPDAHVRGVAERYVTADRGVWQAFIQISKPSYVEAVQLLDQQEREVLEYLINAGVAESAVRWHPLEILSPAADCTHQDNGPQVYRLKRALELRMDDVQNLSKIVEKSSELNKKGILLHTVKTIYYIHDTAPIKLEMFAEAEKNAWEMARTLLQHTGAPVGAARTISQLAFEVNTPQDETLQNGNAETGDASYTPPHAQRDAINDMTSINKKLRAVVSATFPVQN